MGETISQIAGRFTTFTHNDKEYNVSLFTQNVKAAFEQWVQDLAWSSLYASRRHMPPDEFEKDKADLTLRMRYGYFCFLGTTCQAVLQTASGGMKLVSLMLGCDEITAMGLLAARREELMDLLQRAMADSMPVQKETPKAPPAGSSSPDATQSGAAPKV